MRWFDFLFKSEPAKSAKEQRPSATPPKVPSVKPTEKRPISKPETEKAPAVEDTAQQPMSKPETEKAPAVEAITQQPISKQETKKKVSIKVS